MNILVTATTFPKNITDSSPRFVYDLCHALQLKNKLNPIVLVPHSYGSLNKEKINNLQVYRYQYFLSKYELISGNGIISNIRRNKLLCFLIPFLILFQLIKSLILIKKYDIKIILANWLIPQGFVAILVKLLLRNKIKVIVIAHGGDVALLTKNKLFKKLAYIISNNVDQLVAVSSFLQNKLIKLNTRHKDIPVISMGVNTTKFKQNSTIQEKTIDIIFLGRLEEKKGVKFLIEAIHKLNMNVKMVIIGDGTVKDDLQKLVKQYNLQKNIDFTGSLNHENILYYMHRSKIFVAPSINLKDDTEGLPTVLLEAMASDLPVITTDAGGIKDLIVDGYNGVLVEQKNSKDLALKIKHLLESPSDRNKLIQQSKATIKKYSYDSIAAKYEQIIIRTHTHEKLDKNT